jgi:hypothetical protein
LRKVYEIPEFRGVYKDSEGQVYDLRGPAQSKPSLNAFGNRGLGELQGLLFKAYKMQLDVLEGKAYKSYDPEFEADLKNELKNKITSLSLAIRSKGG